jgi:hypothetical protein
MQELIEFRMPEKHVREFLPLDLGAPEFSVRKIKLLSTDPLVARIGALQREFSASGRSFFLGWSIERRYSDGELIGAPLFHVRPKRVLMPAGEECGTRYDESDACGIIFASVPERSVNGHRVPGFVDRCGVGARQATSLFLDGRRIPRGADFSRTIANEVVVSERFVAAFRAAELTGAEFAPVCLSDLDGIPSSTHFQLEVVGQRAEISPTTRAGEHPFDERGYGRCPRGHCIGIGLISEVEVIGASISEADVMATRQMVGVRRGLLRPGAILLFSQRARRALNQAKLKGLEVEPCRLT